MPLGLLAFVWGNVFLSAWFFLVKWIKVDVVNVIIFVLFLAIAVWVTVLGSKCEEKKKKEGEDDL